MTDYWYVRTIHVHNSIALSWIRTLVGMFRVLFFSRLYKWQSRCSRRANLIFTTETVSDIPSERRSELRREDIQLLRGIAVLTVVVYHSGIMPIPAGYLGVDVFFVISGFLITSHILRDINRGSFSLLGFYLRRARRLLPATYCTLSIATVAAYFLLSPSAWPAFLKQLLGALTFTANIFLWRQSGYFQADSAMKPLMHLWSLSVEEQYYLLFPFALLFFRPRSQLPFIACAIVSSFALCLYLVSIKQTMAFYLLPARAWEILLGSLGAFVVARSGFLAMPRMLRYFALAVIILIPLFPLEDFHPRTDAVIISMATLFILVGEGAWLHTNILTAGFSRIGDISYSLYLVHWPLFAFASILYLGRIPLTVSIAIVFVSLLLAIVQYRYIEQPFQVLCRSDDRRYVICLIAAAALLLAVPVSIYFFGTTKLAQNHFEHVRRFNSGLDPGCAYAGGKFEDRPQCRLSPTPRVALWGDSYAMHWAAGISAAFGGTDLIQMTKSTCAPLKGVAILLSRDRAESCISFNEGVIKYLSEHPSIHTVVMSSPFSYSDYGGKPFLAGKALEPANITTAALKFVETISALRDMGKRVVLIAPPPTSDFNIGECLEREASGMLVLGRSNCDVRYEKYVSARSNVTRLLDAIHAATGVQIITPADVTCDGNICRTKIDGKYLYRDRGHLTYDGSVTLARLLKLGELRDPP